MNGEVPNVPITTLAGITSLTDCKYAFNILFSFILLIIGNINSIYVKCVWMDIR